MTFTSDNKNKTFLRYNDPNDELKLNKSKFFRLRHAFIKCLGLYFHFFLSGPAYIDIYTYVYIHIYIHNIYFFI